VRGFKDATQYPDCLAGAVTMRRRFYYVRIGQDKAAAVSVSSKALREKSNPFIYPK
jgi:hypothetical protein